jgi:hypothetical protein
MRSSAAPLGAPAAMPAVPLALAAFALLAVLVASLPLLDLLSCAKLWQHGVAACLR